MCIELVMWDVCGGGGDGGGQNMIYLSSQVFCVCVCELLRYILFCPIRNSSRKYIYSIGIVVFLYCLCFVSIFL